LVDAVDGVFGVVLRLAFSRGARVRRELRLDTVEPVRLRDALLWIEAVSEFDLDEPR